MNERIRVHRSGTFARLQPGSFLGRDRFKDYQRAIEGARYLPEKDKRSNFAALDKLPVILERLRHAAFHVDLDREIDQILSERDAKEWQDKKSLESRIDAIDAAIREKNRREDRGDIGLFPFQRTGAKWLARRYGALLADQQRMGKTLAVITALPPSAPTVIVAPVAAKGVWLGEIERWRPQLRTEMLSGRKSFRWPKEGEILVTNYDVLPATCAKGCDGFLEPVPCKGCKESIVFEPHVDPRTGTVQQIPVPTMGHQEGCDGFIKRRCTGCAPFLKEATPGTVLVGDEAQKIKGANSLRALRFRALSEAVRAVDGRCWLLSGTPLENDPLELWYILKAAGIAEEAFGSRKQFIALFKGKKLDYGYAWGIPDAEVVDRLQRVCLRRMRKDVWSELPPKRWQEHLVTIDRKAVAECERILRRVGGDEAFSKLLDQNAKLAFETISSARAALAAAKIPAVLEIVRELEEAGELMIVYSMHREPVDTLAKLPGWASITGDVSDKDRTKIIANFQAGRYKGLSCTIQAAGTGINLSRARYGIFVDLSYKPTEIEQAEDRQVHLEQKEGNVYIIIKADHPLDRRVVEILMRKRRLIAHSVDAARVTDDAPAAEPPEGKLKQEIEALLARDDDLRVVFHPEDRANLTVLQTAAFLPEYRGMILELAERAEMCGLSDDEWALVARLAADTSLRDPVKDTEKVPPSLRLVTSETENVSDESAEVVHEESASEEDEESDDMPNDEHSKLKRAASSRKTDEETDTEDLLATLDSVGDAMIEAGMTLASGMTDGTRAEFFDRLGGEFCSRCAHMLPEKGEHVCPDDDEDEDEDEGDDDQDDDVVTTAKEIDG